MPTTGLKTDESQCESREEALSRWQRTFRGSLKPSTKKAIFYP